MGDDVPTFVIGIVPGTRTPNILNNATNVALIPKVKSLTLVSEFRPVGVCNVIYKLVSKVLANKLKLLLPEVILVNQGVFILSRLITDNALVALELFHTMHERNKGSKGAIAMKLDMSKTFDRMERSFLRIYYYVWVLESLGSSLFWIVFP